MVRTTITLAEEELEDLRRLAVRQDRSISWLVRQAFRLSKTKLERGEPYAVAFDRMWGEVGCSLRRTGVRTTEDVDRLVAEVRGRNRGTNKKARAQ